MKWQTEPKHIVNMSYQEKLEQWQTWFAWRPITVADGYVRVWLETVERRVARWCGPEYDIRPVYEYREIK